MPAPATDVTHPDNLERRLFRQLRDTCVEHRLITPDDRILVAVSGGKDSYTLLYLLERLVRSLAFRVDLVAVHLDQQQPGYNGTPLVDWLEKSGVKYEILSEDTYSTVMSKLPEGATYCSLCSRLRRGILYTAAERLGCTKIALGHHRDDGLETFLMNLFYSGKLQAMPAIFREDGDRFDVIRPLIDCAERDIAEFAVQQAFPILPCNLCGSQDGLKREQVAALLTTLEQDNPNLRAVMARALANVKPTHLLDREVRDAWLGRPDTAAVAPKEARPTHFDAAPARSNMRLPILR